MQDTLTEHPELIPLYEPQRLDALSDYQVLSQPGQPLFNDLVHIMAQLFRVPVALVSLVREHDVLFAGSTGLPPEATTVPRSQSICSVAILQDGLTLYRDLLQRPCHLVDSSTVRNLDLNFYAGKSLYSSSGYPIGSLCVMDHQPRDFSSSESALLEQMAHVTTTLLDLQVALQTDEARHSALWARINEQIAQSLARLTTLAELSAWETDPTSEAAQAYQRSTLEEAARVATTIQAELQRELTQLRHLTVG
jgi:hypothetical protein